MMIPNSTMKMMEDEWKSRYAAVCAELEELQNSLPKIKADAVREAVNDVVQNLMMYNGTDLDIECTDDLLRYADKLEKGE